MWQKFDNPKVQSGVMEYQINAFICTTTNAKMNKYNTKG